MGYQDRSPRRIKKLRTAAAAGLAGIAIACSPDSSPSHSAKPIPTIAERPSNTIDLRTPRSFLNYAYPEVRALGNRTPDNAWFKSESGVNTAVINLTPYTENRGAIKGIIDNVDAFLEQGGSYEYTMPDGSKRILKPLPRPIVGREVVFISPNTPRPAWSNGRFDQDQAFTQIYGSGREVAPFTVIEVDNKPAVTDPNDGTISPDGLSSATINTAIQLVYASTQLDVRNEEGNPYALASEQAFLSRKFAEGAGIVIALRGLGLTDQQYQDSIKDLENAGNGSNFIIGVDRFKQLPPPKTPGTVLVDIL